MDFARRPRNMRELRYQMGEENASSGTSANNENASYHFFDTKNPRLEYPNEFNKHPTPIRYYAQDPWQHLGRIGYKRNTYQFRGPEKDVNNIYGGQHMKKTLWLEEMRRRIYAEKCGISAEIDESNIAGTAEVYYIKNWSREKRNPHLSWTRQTTTH